MANRTILIVDDEKDIQKLLQYNLEKEGYKTLSALTGEEGLELAKSKKPDLVLLDLMLPGIDGLEVCRLLRGSPETKTIPVIMLTAKSSEVDQVVGLELGASDYIPKPFSVKVLTARIKNIFRNQQSTLSKAVVIRDGDLALDGERVIFTIKNRPVSLTKLEFSILSFLMEHKGRVFSRDQLLSGAWPGEAFVVDRTVDVHIKSIRRKLGKHRGKIETVRGLGYRFAES